MSLSKLLCHTRPVPALLFSVFTSRAAGARCTVMLRAPSQLEPSAALPCQCQYRHLTFSTFGETSPKAVYAQTQLIVPLAKKEGGTLFSPECFSLRVPFKAFFSGANTSTLNLITAEIVPLPLLVTTFLS